MHDDAAVVPLLRGEEVPREFVDGGFCAVGFGGSTGIWGKIGLGNVEYPRLTNFQGHSNENFLHNTAKNYLLELNGL